MVREGYLEKENVIIYFCTISQHVASYNSLIKMLIFEYLRQGTGAQWWRLIMYLSTNETYLMRKQLPDLHPFPCSTVATVTKFISDVNGHTIFLCL